MVYPYRFLPIPHFPHVFVAQYLRVGLGVTSYVFRLRRDGTGKSLVLYKEGLIDLEAGSSDKS